MTVITISGCYKCQPDKWRKGKAAVGSYQCTNCRKYTRHVMEKRKEEEK